MVVHCPSLFLCSFIIISRSVVLWVFIIYLSGYGFSLSISLSIVFNCLSLRLLSFIFYLCVYGHSLSFSSSMVFQTICVSGVLNLSCFPLFSFAISILLSFLSIFNCLSLCSIIFHCFTKLSIVVHHLYSSFLIFHHLCLNRLTTYIFRFNSLTWFPE